MVSIDDGIQRFRSKQIVLGKLAVEVSGVELALRSQSDGKGLGTRVSQRQKGSSSILLSEDLLITNLGNVGTKVLVPGGLGRGTELQSSRPGGKLLNVHTTIDFISVQEKTKSGMAATDLESLGVSSGKGIEPEGELRNRRLSIFSRKRITLLSALEMHNIGRDLIQGQVIHAFIKPGMSGKLDLVCSWVISQDVLGGIRNETKKDAFDGVVAELDFAATRGPNPNSTTKSAEAREILLGLGSKVVGTILKT